MLRARNYPFKWVSCGVVFFFYYSSNETLWHQYIAFCFPFVEILGLPSLQTRRQLNVWKSTIKRKRIHQMFSWETFFTHFLPKFLCCSFKLGFEGRLIKSRGKLMTGAPGSLINADFAGCVENACSCINIGAEKVSLYILKIHNRRLFMAKSEISLLWRLTIPFCSVISSTCRGMCPSPFLWLKNII